MYKISLALCIINLQQASYTTNLSQLNFQTMLTFLFIPQFAKF